MIVGLRLAMIDATVEPHDTAPMTATFTGRVVFAVHAATGLAPAKGSRPAMVPCESVNPRRAK